MADTEDTTKGTESSEGSEQSPTDYKTLFEAEQTKTAENAATITKLEKDGSSLRGQIKSQSNRDAEIGDQISGLNSQVSALARAQAGSDIDLLATIDKTEATTAANTAQRRYDARYASYHGTLMETLMDDEGNVILEMNEAPELETMRKLWNQGVSTENISVADRLDFYQQAIGEADKARRAKERSLRKEATDAEKEAASEAKTQKMDNDSGPVGGSATEKSLDDLMTTKIKDLSPKELQDHHKKFWAAARSESGVNFRHE